MRLPRSLFDSVADNLIRNALAKRAGDADVRVRVASNRGERVVLRVCDRARRSRGHGRQRAARAGRSRSGLGIGLYQAARQAEASGYRLVLESNRDGEVLLRADRNAGLGQHARGDEPPVELPDRDPQQQVVVLTAGRALRARRATRTPGCC